MSIQPMAEPFSVRGHVGSLSMAETSGGSQGNLSLHGAGLSILLKVFSWLNQTHSASFPFWLTQNYLSYLLVQNSFPFCHILRVRGKGQILLILNGKGLWQVSTPKGRYYALTLRSMFFSCVKEVFLHYHFYHEWMLNFTRCLFCIYGDNFFFNCSRALFPFSNQSSISQVSRTWWFFLALFYTLLYLVC